MNSERDKRGKDLKEKYQIYHEISSYIIKNIINSSKMDKTVTIYRTDFYKIFPNYSRKEVDISLRTFCQFFNEDPNGQIRSIGGYLGSGPSTKVEEIKIKNKKGWFS